MHSLEVAIGLGTVKWFNARKGLRFHDINSALRVLKKKTQREGTFREMKRRRAYEKPSERRVREKAEAVRRHRKVLRKRMEREDY
jgi:small subunit ribosomal protein S21